MPEKDTPSEVTSAVRLVFMGTPPFAVPCLRALVEHGYTPLAVYTRPDRPAGRGLRPHPPPVKIAAQELGLPVYQPESLRRPEEIEALRSLQPDVVVVCAYGEILRRPILQIPSKGILNVHPSLLPRHRGPSPIPAAILGGDQTTGVTIMLMDEGMDTGPILSQRSIPIEPLDTAETLATKLSQLAAPLLVETIGLWLRGELSPRPQDHSQATVTKLLRKEDGLINWHLSAVELWRMVRAYHPWPGTFAHFQGETIFIRRAWPIEYESSKPIGTVISLPPELQPLVPRELGTAAFGVQTGKGVLAVLEAQRAGKKPLSSTEFIRGMPKLVGAILEGRPG